MKKLLNNNAFTLIEILITLLILGIVLSAVYITFVGTLKEFKQESVKTTSQVQKSVGSSIIRLDLEHAGFGLAKNLNNFPIEIDNSSGNWKITIRSTINSTNNQTFKWALYSCDNTSSANLLSGDNLTNGTKVVYLDASKDTLDFISDNLTINGNCPPGIINTPILAYEYTSGVTSGCTTQFCNIITYQLSSSAQNLTNCNPNTKNLIRRVGVDAINGTGGEPILSCIADFRTRVLLNGSITNDKVIGSTSTDINYDEADEIRTGLQRIDVYILLQEGNRDRDFTYPNSSITIDGITMNLPANYQHYRWKVEKISVIPMGL